VVVGHVFIVSAGFFFLLCLNSVARKLMGGPIVRSPETLTLPTIKKKMYTALRTLPPSPPFLLWWRTIWFQKYTHDANVDYLYRKISMIDTLVVLSIIFVTMNINALSSKYMWSRTLNVKECQVSLVLVHSLSMKRRWRMGGCMHLSGLSVIDHADSFETIEHPTITRYIR
jgi:hypothetical protein